MKRLSHAGTVTSISTHYGSPDHVQVTVAHGKKKKGKKGEPTSYDDRPTSNITLPKAQAGQFSVGKRANVGIGQSNTVEPDEDDAAPYRRAVRNIITGTGRKKRR